MPGTHHSCCCVSCAMGPHECLTITLAGVTTRCIVSVDGSGNITWGTSGDLVEESATGTAIWNHWVNYAGSGGSVRGTRTNAAVNGLTTSATPLASTYRGTMSDGTALDVNDGLGYPDGTSRAQIIAEIRKVDGECELTLNVWEGTQNEYHDASNNVVSHNLLMEKVFKFIGTVSMAAARSETGAVVSNDFTALPTNISGFGSTGGDGFGIVGYGGTATVKITTCGPSCWNTTEAECDDEGAWTKTAALSSSVNPPRALDRWIRDSETGLWYFTTYAGPSDGDCDAYTATAETSDPPSCIGGKWYVITTKTWHASGHYTATLTGIGTYNHPATAEAWIEEAGAWKFYHDVGTYDGTGNPPWCADARLWTPERSHPPYTGTESGNWCITRTINYGGNGDPAYHFAQLENSANPPALDCWIFDGNQFDREWHYWEANEKGIGDCVAANYHTPLPPHETYRPVTGCEGGYRCWHITVWAWVPPGEFNPGVWIPTEGSGPELAAADAYTSGAYTYWTDGGTCYARKAVNYGAASTLEDCEASFVIADDPPASGCP